MQFFTVATTALLASLTAAAPAMKVKTNLAQRDFPKVTVTYIGAAETSYAVIVPADGTQYSLNDPLSVTYISSDAPAGVTCTSYGIDGSVTVNYGPQEYVPIGPPQTQLYVVCA